MYTFHPFTLFLLSTRHHPLLFFLALFILCLSLFLPQMHPRTPRCYPLPVSLPPTDAPKNTSVLARPSNVIDSGVSLTLTCSSQANPAVENYTWYRINAADAWETRSGPSYTIAEVSPRASGQYYCEARNRIGTHSSPVLTVRVRGQEMGARVYTQTHLRHTN